MLPRGTNLVFKKMMPMSYFVECNYSCVAKLIINDISICKLEDSENVFCFEKIIHRCDTEGIGIIHFNFEQFILTLLSLYLLTSNYPNMIENIRMKICFFKRLPKTIYNWKTKMKGIKEREENTFP